MAVGAPYWNNGVSNQVTGRIYMFRNVNGVWKNDYITDGTSEYIDIPEISYAASNTADDNYSREFGARIAMNKNYLVASREVDLAAIEYLFIREIIRVNMIMLKIFLIAFIEKADRQIKQLVVLVHIFL